MIRRAFTLMELLVVMSLVLIATAIVVPTLGSDARLRLIAASSLVTSDIEYAQVLTVSEPGRPVAIRFDPENVTYWIARQGSLSTPIPHDPSGDPYLVTFGSGRGRAAEGVTITLTGINGDTVAFSPDGGLYDPTSQPRITLRDRNQWVRLDLSNSTGSITQTFGEDEEEEEEETGGTSPPKGAAAEVTEPPPG